MDYYEGVVREFLDANRATFLNEKVLDQPRWGGLSGKWKMAEREALVLRCGGCEPENENRSAL